MRYVTARGSDGTERELKLRVYVPVAAVVCVLPLRVSCLRGPAYACVFLSWRAEDGSRVFPAVNRPPHCYK